MGRRGDVWRRKGSKGSWYTTAGDGTKVLVAPRGATKAVARRAAAGLKAAEGRAEVKATDLTVADVAGAYLADRARRAERGEVARATLKTARLYVGAVADLHGKLPASALTPERVEAWLDGEAAWGLGTRRLAASRLKAWLGWAVRAGHLKENPLRHLRAPAPPVRESAPSDADVAAVVGASPPAFADLIRALWWTGCRPSEVYTLTVDRVRLDSGTWSVVDKIRGKTGQRHRTVYLNDEALALSRKLVGSRAEGLVFRNARGGAWSGRAVTSQLLRLRAKGAPANVTAYGLRHLFATTAAVNGVPELMLTELMGHKNSAMVRGVYLHIGDRADKLREAARMVRAST